MGLVLPTALLETRGARTGRLRRNGVIYFHDGKRVTIIASKLGDNAGITGAAVLARREAK